MVDYETLFNKCNTIGTRNKQYINKVNNRPTTKNVNLPNTLTTLKNKAVKLGNTKY